MKVLYIFFFILLAYQVKSADDPCTPQQIHLSLSDAFTWSPTTNNYAKVIFHTKENCTSAYISLKTPQGTQKITTTTVNFFKKKYPEGVYSTYVHIFDFQNLEFSQIYEYSCFGSDDNSFLAKSQGPFEFYLPNPNFTNEETRVVIFGDMDTTQRGMTTVNRLINLAQNNFTKISTFIHDGDLAYALVSKAGKVGDDYMNGIQAFTATMPYMVTAGNHETWANFSNFNMRFQMPNFAQSQNHYYSFNLGNIHFTSFNLDLVIKRPELKKYMLTWLEQDLQKAAQNKDKYPWIVAYTHRPLYCSAVCEDCISNYQTFSEFEDLLVKYKVDLLVGGHIHVYERILPTKKGQMAPFHHIPEDTDYNYIINPEAPVHIVQGKAGHGDDKDGPFNEYKVKVFTAKIDNYYSFLAVSSKNSTHLLVENYRSDNGTVNDFMYIIKSDSVDLEQIPLAHLKYVQNDNSGLLMRNSLFVFVLIFVYIIFV